MLLTWPTTWTVDTCGPSGDLKFPAMPWPWHVADVAIALVFEGTIESTRTMPISQTPGTCGFSSRIVFSPEASQTQRVDNLRVHHDAYLAIPVQLAQVRYVMYQHNFDKQW